MTGTDWPGVMVMGPTGVDIAPRSYWPSGVWLAPRFGV